MIDADVSFSSLEIRNWWRWAHLEKNNPLVEGPLKIEQHNEVVKKPRRRYYYVSVLIFFWHLPVSNPSVVVGHLATAIVTKLEKVVQSV